MNPARLEGNWSTPEVFYLPDILPPLSIVAKQEGIAMEVSEDEAPTMAESSGSGGLPDGNDIMMDGDLKDFRIEMDLNWVVPPEAPSMIRRRRQAEVQGDSEPMVLDMPVMGYTIVVGMEAIEDPFGEIPEGHGVESVTVSFVGNNVPKFQ